MNKRTENIFWIVAIVAIVAVGLSDTLTWSWVKNNWILLLIVFILMCGSNAISMAYGHYRGYITGRSEGYALGFKGRKVNF